MFLSFFFQPLLHLSASDPRLHAFPPEMAAWRLSGQFFCDGVNNGPYLHNM